MASIVVVTRITSGTESNAILNELARWGEQAATSVDRRSEDALELHFDVDHPPARQMVEDALNMANASWPVHVRVEQP